MMKSRIFTITMLACLLASRVMAEDKVRVGVYDSRAVAGAFYMSDLRKAEGGDPLGKKRAKAQEELALAKTAGDSKRIKELKGELLEMRQQRARQLFGAAPVDDILELIKDRLPEIRSVAKVESLVSMSDSKELAKHEGAERVDVTLLIVAEFNPSKKTLQQTWGFMHMKPISAEDTDRAVKKGI